MHALAAVGQGGPINAELAMQQVQSVQATEIATLDNRFLSWPSMLSARGLAEESTFGSVVYGGSSSLDMGMQLSTPSKEPLVKQETAQGSQQHSPDCLLIRFEHAQQGRQSCDNEYSLHSETSSGVGAASQQLGRNGNLDKGGNVRCGCNDATHKQSCLGQNLHPRVDNSALGFSEHDKFEGLEDIVSFTAVSFAAYRAIESERPDALFHDPLAEHLAGEVLDKQKAALANQDYPGGRFAVRTKYFDNKMMSAIKGMKARNPEAKVQVVIFGCGMDARSWRLPASLEGLPPAEVVFEADKGDVIGLKQRVIHRLEEEGKMPGLTLGLRREVLSIDFRSDTWKELILEKGFRTSEPTVWLFEGLIMYLTPEEAAELVDTVAEMSAPGSVLLSDGLSASAVERAKNSPSPVMRSWFWGSNDPESYFNAHGWKVQSVDDVTSGMFGRELPHWPGKEKFCTWYMTAKRE